MDISSTSRNIVETTHVVVMSVADQGALFAVAARNKAGAPSDAPATLTKQDDGSVSVSIVVTADAPQAAEQPAPQMPVGSAISLSQTPVI